MSKKAMSATLPVFALVAMMASLGLGVQDARAEVAVMHYAGYGFEEGGFQHSTPGQELNVMTRITNVHAQNPFFPYSPDANEYTVVLTGLVSQGEQTEEGVTTIFYGDGRLEIYEDSSFDSTWDEVPSIGNPPTTFTNGELWLSGNFMSFMLVIVRESGQGYFEGSFQLEGGTARPYVEGDAYTFAGILADPSQPYLPTGYDFAADGEIWIHETTATESSSWSAVKALF